MLTIPTEYVRATRLTDFEMLLEIAVLLFQKEKLTLGQAARLAGMPQFRFQSLLASRDISIHYGIEDYREDLQTLKSLAL
jgi:predicted HTH domain antitoxin